MRKKDKTNLLKVGFFVASLTAVLMIMIISIGKENSIFASKSIIKARVTNVANLKPGSYVELKGIKVGTVTDIKIISEDEVEISMSVLQSEIKWIKKDSQIAISTAGLVGDKYLEIHSGSKEAEPINPEKDILYSEKATDIKQIISKGESIATLTERMLARLDKMLTSLTEGQKLADSVNALHKTTKNMESITTELKGANIGQTMNNLNKASETMDRIMSRVEKGPGTMNSLIYDDSLHDELRGLLGGAQRNKVIKYFIRESIKNSEKKQNND